MDRLWSHPFLRFWCGRAGVLILQDGFDALGELHLLHPKDLFSVGCRSSEEFSFCIYTQADGAA
jgi:hypothetical protein